MEEDQNNIRPFHQKLIDEFDKVQVSNLAKTKSLISTLKIIKFLFNLAFIPINMEEDIEQVKKIN